MNSIDNGVKEVIWIKRVIKEDEVYFLVELKDLYDRIREKKFMSIKNIENRRWTE